MRQAWNDRLKAHRTAEWIFQFKPLLMCKSAKSVPQSCILQRYILTHGFGFIPIDGSWTENTGTPDQEKVSERFYLVIGNDNDSGNLKGFLHKQDIS